VHPNPLKVAAEKLFFFLLGAMPLMVGVSLLEEEVLLEKVERSREDMVVMVMVMVELVSGSSPFYVFCHCWCCCVGDNRHGSVMIYFKKFHLNNIFSHKIF